MGGLIEMRSSPFSFYLCGALALALFVGFLTTYYLDFHLLYSYFLSFAITAIFLIGLDKGLSKTTATRVPERVFLILALLGGTPGVLLGMIIFRHKISKTGFIFWLISILVLQIAALLYFGVSR